MTDMPEDWAIGRACQLLNSVAFATVWSATDDAENAYVKVLASYIQSHEKPPEPDWEAWRPALEAYYASRPLGDVANSPLDETDMAMIRSLIAASKVMPK